MSFMVGTIEFLYNIIMSQPFYIRSLEKMYVVIWCYTNKTVTGFHNT